MPMREGNPFEYVRPLEPQEVTGRDDLCHTLLLAVRDRRLAALTGPRRFGKTSVLGRVAWLAADVDTDNVVVVDSFGVASIGDFAVRLERAMDGLTGRFRQAVSRRLEGSELGLSLTPGLGFKARFGSRDNPDPLTALHELLDVLATVANRESGLLLVLDEFQDAGRVDGLDAVLRSHLQGARDVAVLFAGSRPTLMRQLFSDRARPFYAQAEIVEIQRFARGTAADIVREGFGDTGLDAGDLAEAMAVSTDGHPQRLMLTAHLAWERVMAGADSTVETAQDALIQARARAEFECAAVFDGLDRTFQDTIRAVAVFGSPHARAAERAFGLKRPSAQTAARALLADALIEQVGDAWRITDPFLRDWLVGLGQPKNV